MNVKVVHLFSEPGSEREVRSSGSLSSLSVCDGVRYVRVVNAPFRDPPPQGNCRRPDAVVNYHPTSGDLLGPGHYGCFDAHRKAVAEEFTEDVDGLVICECDCLLNVSASGFLRILEEIHSIANDFELDCVSLGGMACARKDRSLSPLVNLVDLFFQTHCMFFPARVRGRLQCLFNESPWDTIDWWYNAVLDRKGATVYAVASQLGGPSLLNSGRKLGVNRIPPSCHKSLMPLDAFQPIMDLLAGRKIYYHSTTGHAGDFLIQRGAYRLFHKVSVEVIGECLPREVIDQSKLAEADFCVWPGGGNLGEFYSSTHERRRELCALSQKMGVRFVVLPQSVTPGRLEEFPADAVVFSREHRTKKLYPESILVPDLAMAVDDCKKRKSTEKLGVFLRTDDERADFPHLERYSIGDTRLPRNADAILALASQYEIVLTNRLHLAISALLQGRKVFLAKNGYFKNEAMYETWLKQLGCNWVEDETFRKHLLLNMHLPRTLPYL